MNALSFKLYLRQPLLIGQVGAGEENSAISFDHIAGSTIRGALIGRYMETHGEFALAALPRDAEVRRLFFNGNVTYLNAYPQDEQGQRTLPAPRSWKVEKAELDELTATIIDTAIADIAAMKDPKSLGEPFCSPAEDEVTLYAPKRHTGLHNASTERYVKREDDSFVFRYEALAADQIFCGAILSEDDASLGRIETLLQPSDLFLGRSRSAGYGHTEIIEVTRVKEWQEYQQPEPDELPDCITLTLLSDAIVRNQYGQYVTTLDTIPTIKASLMDQFVAAGLTGGFNRKWGLPLPQVPVIKAGSVWTFTRTAETTAALQALVTTGIGERRMEGFGRVAVDWQQHEKLSRRALIVERRRTIAVSLNGTAQTLAKQMVDRLYRQELDRKLLKQTAGSFTIRGKVPENTQLSRLRIIVRRAWREQNSSLVTDFLKNLKSTARNQYLQAQVERKSLLEWLEEGWQNDTLWRTYFYISPTDLPKIGDVQAQENDAIKLEYSARLVDLLCNQAIKQQQAEAAKQPVEVIG
ncbi:MAG TPA: hypothetical protein P5121_33965 [Caldilineaceae bacterium]|nr:hypothetical protein [Caldilineaceae bacterium]